MSVDSRNNSLKVSFSGTQLGLSKNQVVGLSRWLEDWRESISMVAHGCCIGADSEFHRLVREICGKTVYIAGFPSTLKMKSEIPCDLDYVHEALPPLDRNKLIVEVGNILLLCPKENFEIVRSGTWQTKRCAVKANKPYKIFER